MKTTKTNFLKKYLMIFKGIFIISLLSIGLQSNAQTDQTIQYTRPSWFFGVAGGANFNFYNGSTHQLTTDFTPPVVFNDGQGVGLYIAPLIEYHKPDSRFGFMLQAGYDNRQGKFEQTDSPCNCPSDLSTDITYVSLEPSLRIAPFKGNFYLYTGPRFAYNISKGFDYKQGINPDFPDQVIGPDVKDDFSDVNKTQISMQVGAGYDIYLSSQDNRTQFVLSPFASYHPYIGQTPRSIETWNITTVRAGVALKLGRGREIPIPVVIQKEVFIPIPVPEVRFTINSPSNVQSSNMVQTYPIRNYVFFDKGSTKIPSRYIVLNKGEKIEVKSDQMGVYYNVLNIVGYRMVSYPESNIVLVGSSEKGVKDAKEMSLSVKTYLVSVYGIDESRITVKGKKSAYRIENSENKDLEYLRESDRRVVIESKYPELLTGYQTNSQTNEIRSVSVAPVDSYVTFNVDDGSKVFSSWSLEMLDSKNNVKKFGPYTENKVSIPTADILGKDTSGKYKVTMIGLVKNDYITRNDSLNYIQNDSLSSLNNTIIRKDSTVNIVLWKSMKDNSVMKYSILFDFDSFVVNDVYKSYLNSTIIANIPQNGIVIINGYTDVIGDEEYNKKLSLQRANSVNDIIVEELGRLNRTDVKIEINGLGETNSFDNTTPEGRYYNRAVIIDLNK